MNPAMFHGRTHWLSIIAFSCSIWSATLVGKSSALQVVPDTAELRIVALPVPSATDQTNALPTSQTRYITGDTFFLELWAQTTAAEGLVQASADLSFDPTAVTAVGITHTPVFGLFPAGTINNLAGTIDNLSGSHTPVNPPCSDQVGATPVWARVAIVEMRARGASVTPITLLDSNDLFFVIAACNSLDAMAATFVGVSLEVQAPRATISLVALAQASFSDLATTVPISQPGFSLGSVFVLEMWAQTDSVNGLAQVSADVSFDSTLVTAGTITHSALFNLFSSGSINNFTGTIDNLSGAHPPVIPSCSDSVGTSPNWARVTTVSMTAEAVGSLTVQSADAADLIFVMAVCGSEVSPVTTFGGVSVAVTLCGNGVVEPGEDCDDGNLLAGDCCSPACVFESTATLCRGAVDTCDAAEFCDGAGACPIDGFQLAGTACGNPANTTCDAADTCDGSGTCLANIAPGTTQCRTVAGDCDVVEFCDGAGTCPIDSFKIAGTACGDPSTSVCDSPDTCDGAGACTPNFSQVTVLCRVAADGCDTDEFCDGVGACPPNTFQAVGTACGDPAITTCDNPDSCDGLGTCEQNLEPVTTVCRSPVSDCDIPEFCDGLGRCPLDGFLTLGTACGDPSTTTCDRPDTCDAVGNCLSNPEPSAVLCRAAIGACDVDDFCDGLGGCSPDVFQPAGTTCGNPTVTICDGADTCDGAGACGANFEPTTTACRPSAPDCDVTEFCDGVGGCPADAFLPAGAACGDTSATACNNPDSCDGTGGCLPNLEPATTVCRVAIDECDQSELCDGLGSCPVDIVAPAGVACGDPSNTICDNPDTCNGAGSCQPNPAVATTSCRAAVGECDAEDFCDGAGRCPPDALQPFGTACGDLTATVCDGPDTCDGAGICQPNPEPATTTCRAAAGACDLVEFCDGAGACPVDAKRLGECRASSGQCDVAESCNGIDNNCPADGFAIVGLACGSPSDTVCDNPDTCDGTGACQSNPESPTTSCRALAGQCDTEDFCDGAGNCPPDAFQILGTPCGSPTSTVCDGADTCDGTGACQTNVKPATTICRATGGACDLTEFCDGVGFCPPDLKKSSECRASVSECDVAEFCDGATNVCPVDGFRASGASCGDPLDTVCNLADTCDGAGACQTNLEPLTTSCRPASGDCDIEELCDGAGLCPIDRFVIAAAPCGDPATSVCDKADTCDGLGACLSNPEPATKVCRNSLGECDPLELCDGAGACPLDTFVLAGTACGDSTVSVCDGADTCNGAGACLNNFATDGTSCTDGLFCTGDEFCQAGLCKSAAAFCTDACEHCTESPSACGWCIFDHNLNRTMDGFDFSFFSGCFGVCVAPGDPCAVANYDGSPDGCIGGGDFGAFSGCFSLTCETCAGCAGPGANSGFAATASTSSTGATVRIVAVDFPQSEDVSAEFPRSRGALSIGERFSLEVWATGSGDAYDGLGSVYVDVIYDPSSLVVEGIQSSDSFALFSRGSADASAGLISALGGCAPVGEGSLGTRSTWVRVATLRMRAVTSGTTTLTAEPSFGPYGVSVFGKFGDLPAGQIEFGTAELDIQRRSSASPKRAVRQRSSR